MEHKHPQSKKIGGNSNPPKDQSSTYSDKTPQDGKGKGRRRGDSRIPKSSTKDCSFKAGNDFSFWNKYPGLLSPAASIKDNYRPGQPLFKGEFYAPMVTILDTIDAYGYDLNKTDPFNTCVRDIWLQLYNKYRGLSFEAADLGMLLIAEIEIVKMVAYTERLLATLNSFDKYNLAYPSAILKSVYLLQEEEIQYLRDNFITIVTQFNILLSKCNRLWIPSDMTVLADKVSLYGYYYKDHDDDKAQIYSFRPKYFGRINETSISTGTAVQFNKDERPMYFQYDGLEVVGINWTLEDMIDKILSSESMNNIIGTLGGYFGWNNILQFNAVNPAAKMEIAYNESILHKIHNSIPLNPQSKLIVGSVLPGELTTEDLGNIDEDVGYYLTQSKGIIYTKLCCAPMLEDYSYVNNSVLPNKWVLEGQLDTTREQDISLTALEMGETVLDTYRAEFTEETVVEGVLFKFGSTVTRTAVGSGQASIGAIIDTSGPEIIEDIKVVYFNTKNHTIDFDSVKIFTTNYMIDADITVFDWFPLGYVCVYNDGLEAYANNFKVDRLFGDYCNCRLVSDKDISLIHYAVTLSAYATGFTNYKQDK